jgi:hypothetical protein
MKIRVTMTHEVEAPGWDFAVQAVLKAPVAHLIDCRVKEPGKRLVHVAPSNVQLAHETLHKAYE